MIEEKMCGTCSMDSEMTREERIRTALSRTPNVMYKCPACTAMHSLHTIATKVKDETLVVMPVKNVEKKEKRKAKDSPDQLQLDIFSNYE